jgi:hypothetical protein
LHLPYELCCESQSSADLLSNLNAQHLSSVVASFITLKRYGEFHCSHSTIKGTHFAFASSKILWVTSLSHGDGSWDTVLARREIGDNEGIEEQIFDAAATKNHRHG